MFNFSERTMGEKVVMIGAGVLVAGNTVMNTVNAIKIRNVKKRVTVVENQIAALDNRLNAIEAAKSASSQAAQQQIPPQQGGQQ